MARKQQFKPGQSAPVSGQYPVVGPRGADTSKPGMGYGRPDKTKR